MTVENILLDCDPGLDDAAAIFLAAGSPRIHVLGITTVAGNQTIERVTKNAFFVAKMAGMGDVPIARGSARPLLRPQVQVCSEIHGETGLGVPVAEPERDPDPRPAAQFIVDVVMREPEKSVTLVATGPLTNVALAARLEPKLVSASSRWCSWAAPATRAMLARRWNSILRTTRKPRILFSMSRGGW